MLLHFPKRLSPHFPLSRRIKIFTPSESHSLSHALLRSFCKNTGTLNSLLTPLTRTWAQIPLTVVAVCGLLDRSSANDVSTHLFLLADNERPFSATSSLLDPPFKVEFFPRATPYGPFPEKWMEPTVPFQQRHLLLPSALFSPPRPSQST